MPFDFDTMIERRGTRSLKWDKYRDRDILPMWVADMDFRSPPAVIQALHERVEHGVFGYTLPPKELHETIIAMMRTRHAWEIQPEWIVWLPGLVTGLNVACRCLGGTGREIVTTTPAYPPFLLAPELAGHRLVTVPHINTGTCYEFDFDRLEEAITPAAGMFILCNPQNPTGRVFTASELTRLAEICLKHGLIICSDEIHCDLVLDVDKQHIPMAALDPAIAARTITLLAPSKTYNLPGLGCSLAIIPDAALRTSFNSAMYGIVPHVGTLGFTATLAAYRDSEDWRQELIDYLRHNRDLVEGSISRMPGLCMCHVQATYLAWIDARELGLNDPTGFFEQAGVGLSEGAIFGAPGFVRLNFGCPRSLLQQALDRMAAAGAGLNL